MARVRWVVPVLLLVLAPAVFAAPRKAATRPPKQLHKVGDHWTPYNPPDPATFPANAKVHTIVRGDTLWDLASTYYGNAYLWPQLWEANTYITDAHWIYPGDPLLVEGEAGSGDVSTTTGLSGESTTTGGVEQDSGPMTAEMRASAPFPLGSEADILCWGYLGHPDEPMPNRIVSFEDVETKYTRMTMSQDIGVATGDIVYLEGGTSTGLTPGETYLVVKRDEIIRHPKTHEILGRHYDYRGQMRILCATEDQATAIVTQACSDINLGDRLKPMPVLPIPLVRLTEMTTVCTPPSGKTAGFIVNSKDNRLALGVGAVIQINLGADDFVQPGDFLTVFRENPVEGNPRQLLGEIGVLTAENHTATARVVRMRYAMRVGDRVELK